MFLAVDAQPDGTVARKRFWRGNFLFAQEPALGDAGFKRFRPIVRDKSGGLRRLTNAEIAKNPQYGDFSLEQTKMSIEAFYDRMDDVMSPAPLDPLGAMKEAITSLDEQVRARVTSVENGRKYQNSGKGEASMPDGAAIFETTGAWEDFATPSRDLRLLIAMDVVRDFPDRVVRRPERYAMPKDKSVDAVKAELQARAGAGIVEPQILLSAQRRIAMDADAEGSGRSRHRSRDGLQRQRLRRTAMGCAGKERRGIDLQALRTAGPALEDDVLPPLVQRTPPAAAHLTPAAPRNREVGARRADINDALNPRFDVDSGLAAIAEAMTGTSEAFEWRTRAADTRRIYHGAGILAFPGSVATALAALSGAAGSFCLPRAGGSAAHETWPRSERGRLGSGLGDTQMHIAMLVVAGLVLLAILHYLPHLLGLPFNGALAFLWIWFAISVLNGLYGHFRAGIPAINEIGAFLPIYLIPAALAFYLMRRAG